MATECIQKDFGFHPLKHREIRAQFDGGAITTEGGGLNDSSTAWFLRSKCVDNEGRQTSDPSVCR